MDKIMKKRIEEAAMRNATCRFYDDDDEILDISVKSFEDGARWRIDSAWHSTDELPKYSGFLAVLMSNGIMETMYFSVGIGFHENQLMGYVLWAYVSDILPERKEENQ